MFRWIARQSAKHQIKNTTCSFLRLVRAAQQLLGQEQGAQALFERQQRGLATDMVGPVTADQLKRLVVEPGLQHLEVQPEIAKAVLSVCDYFINHNPDQTTTFSDDEITKLAEAAIPSGVDEFRSSPDGGALTDAVLRRMVGN